MSDSTTDDTSTEVREADLRNGEPDALDDGSTGAPRNPDDDPDQRLQPGDELDVTEPIDDGDPIHHVAGGDIGDGAD